MDVVALPFGLMGFIFGIIAFNQAASASAKIDKLEQRLIALEGDDLEERS